MSSSSPDLPGYRIPRKPPPGLALHTPSTHPYHHQNTYTHAYTHILHDPDRDARYPAPDPTDPFAPLSVLRTRTSSALALARLTPHHSRDSVHLLFPDPNPAPGARRHSISVAYTTPAVPRVVRVGAGPAPMDTTAPTWTNSPDDAWPGAESDASTASEMVFARTGTYGPPTTTAFPSFPSTPTLSSTASSLYRAPSPLRHSTAGPLRSSSVHPYGAPSSLRHRSPSPAPTLTLHSTSISKAHEKQAKVKSKAGEKPKPKEKEKVKTHPRVGLPPLSLALTRPHRSPASAPPTCAPQLGPSTGAAKPQGEKTPTTTTRLGVFARLLSRAGAGVGSRSRSKSGERAGYEAGSGTSGHDAGASTERNSTPKAKAKPTSSKAVRGQSARKLQKSTASMSMANSNTSASASAAHDGATRQPPLPLPITITIRSGQGQSLRLSIEDGGGKNDGRNEGPGVATRTAPIPAPASAPGPQLDRKDPNAGTSPMSADANCTDPDPDPDGTYHPAANADASGTGMKVMATEAEQTATRVVMLSQSDGLDIARDDTGVGVGEMPGMAIAGRTRAFDAGKENTARDDLISSTIHTVAHTLGGGDTLSASHAGPPEATYPQTQISARAMRARPGLAPITTSGVASSDSGFSTASPHSGGEGITPTLADTSRSMAGGITPTGRSSRTGANFSGGGNVRGGGITPTATTGASAIISITDPFSSSFFPSNGVRRDHCGGQRSMGSSSSNHHGQSHSAPWVRIHRTLAEADHLACAGAGAGMGGDLDASADEDGEGVDGERDARDEADTPTLARPRYDGAGAGDAMKSHTSISISEQEQDADSDPNADVGVTSSMPRQESESESQNSDADADRAASRGPVAGSGTDTGSDTNTGSDTDTDTDTDTAAPLHLHPYPHPYPHQHTRTAPALALALAPTPTSRPPSARSARRSHSGPVPVSVSVPESTHSSSSTHLPTQYTASVPPVRPSTPGVIKPTTSRAGQGHIPLAPAPPSHRDTTTTAPTSTASTSASTSTMTMTVTQPGRAYTTPIPTYTVLSAAAAAATATKSTSPPATKSTPQPTTTSATASSTRTTFYVPPRTILPRALAPVAMAAGAGVIAAVQTTAGGRTRTRTQSAPRASAVVGPRLRTSTSTRGGRTKARMAAGSGSVPGGELGGELGGQVGREESDSDKEQSQSDSDSASASEQGVSVQPSAATQTQVQPAGMEHAHGSSSEGQDHSHAMRALPPKPATLRPLPSRPAPPGPGAGPSVGTGAEELYDEDEIEPDAFIAPRPAPSPPCTVADHISATASTSASAPASEPRTSTASSSAAQPTAPTPPSSPFSNIAASRPSTTSPSTTSPNTTSTTTSEWALPTSAQLAAAAALRVTAEDGTQIAFGTLFAAHRTVVVFIRHFWCPLCQAYMAALRARVRDEFLVEWDDACPTGSSHPLGRRGLELGEAQGHTADPEALAKKRLVGFVVIGNGAYKMIRKYRKIFALPFRVYTDPQRAVYRAFGMGSAAGGGGLDEGHQHLATGAAAGVPRGLGQEGETRVRSSVAEGEKDKEKETNTGAGGVCGSGETAHMQTHAAEAHAAASDSRQWRTGGYVKHGLVGGIAMVVVRALRVGMPVWEKGGDIGQLGGEFVFGPGLQCAYAHRMQTTSGHAPIEDVLAAAGVDLDAMEDARRTLLISAGRDRPTTTTTTTTTTRRRRLVPSISLSPHAPPTPTSIRLASPTTLTTPRGHRPRSSTSTGTQTSIGMRPNSMSAEEEEEWMAARQRSFERLQERKAARRRTPTDRPGSSAHSHTYARSPSSASSGWQDDPYRPMSVESSTESYGSILLDQRPGSSMGAEAGAIPVFEALRAYAPAAPLSAVGEVTEDGTGTERELDPRRSSFYSSGINDDTVDEYERPVAADSESYYSTPSGVDDDDDDEQDFIYMDSTESESGSWKEEDEHHPVVLTNHSLTPLYH